MVRPDPDRAHAVDLGLVPGYPFHHGSPPVWGDLPRHGACPTGWLIRWTWRSALCQRLEAGFPDHPGRPAARGYEVEKLEGGLIAQIRKMAPLVVPVTMNAILSGEDITNAMDLRCFGLHRAPGSRS